MLPLGYRRCSYRTTVREVDEVFPLALHCRICLPRPRHRVTEHSDKLGEEGTADVSQKQVTSKYIKRIRFSHDLQQSTRGKVSENRIKA
jgi:hypothetical protein